jgi:hypothetical protein
MTFARMLILPLAQDRGWGRGSVDERKTFVSHEVLIQLSGAMDGM